MSARRWVALAVALVLASCAGEPKPAGKPNVVVILIDTLRPDHLPCYGYATDTAPFISKLAQQGALFSHAWSASSWTAPATASLFTSLYPPQHGVLEGFFVHRTRAVRDGASVQDAQTITLPRLPSAAKTLPEVFRDAGWSTWGVTANVNVTERIGFDRGFQHFRTLTGPEYGKGGAADQVLKELEPFARPMLAAAPYFLYLHFNDVHSPWTPRPPLFHEGPDQLSTLRSAYDSQIPFVDKAIETCSSALGWDKNTLVCIVSDHGEEFEEHGGRGHGQSLYRELLHVTLLMWSPGRVRSGVVLDDNVSLVDVLPTLCELAGAPAPSGIEGRSFASLLARDGEPSALPERALFAHRKAKLPEDDLWSVVSGDWKLIEHSGKLELYDLHDAAERDDLTARQPEIVERLARELDAFRARAKPLSSEKVDVQLDARAVDALRQLGYAK
jgi:arylsulfatase A-like enzyme